ncbi:monovalent cation:proton antiporter-2 (CPA2) family protein [Sandaracinobacter sp. RS1-74]|uniref:monovalent cation:proton antiporter-2 (CPA2) family protein n=1 Tax=Sandaracinobacteroides sayramensis TaxID=2913411 RepID=UPI001EDB55F0|nr:monovalent cation:proton antiporter-2 (CPA2) family protein [Sandaracinobacteroides sayramensis]
MAGEVDTTVLREAVIYLAAAVVCVPLFNRLKLGAVLGYLVGGLIIGPSLLGLIPDPERAMQFAEYGVVMLLFVVGLELNPARLWALRRDIFGLGTLQVVMCGLALAAALFLGTAFTWHAALVVGLALALSSTALDVQILQDQQKINTPLGERIISIHLLQDLAIVPLLLVTSALARAPSPEVRSGWELLLVALAAIGGLVLAGRYLLNPLFRLIAMAGAREVFVVGALLTVLGASFLMASLGLSMAMGAFIAGVMLADSPWRHEVEADVEPFRGLLLGLFFMAVGMTLDLNVVLANPLKIVVLALLLMAIKLSVVAALARLFGSSWKDASLIGVHLSQGGEFAFIVLGAATAGVLILPEAASLFTAVVTLSMALTVPALMLWHRLFEHEAPPASTEGLEGPDSAPPGSVIVVGYGRFGQIVTQLFHARGVEVVLIDSRPDLIEQSKAFGWKVYYGDGFRPDVLRAAGAEDAQLLIVTTGGAWEPHRLDAVRHAFPHMKIIVRAHDRLHYMRLKAGDVDIAVRELFYSALELGRIALAELGTPPETIDEITEEYVRRDSERLALQAASGDIMAGRETIFRPGQNWRPESADTSLGEIPPAEAASS